MFNAKPDDDKPAGDYVCDTCNEPCDLILEDCGIGTTEFWGSVATHSDWRWVSDCCCDDEVSNKPENENDQGNN